MEDKINLTDEELALRAKDGDAQACEILLNRYKANVLRLARRFFLSGGDTEDLVQEGMCGLYSAILGFKSEQGGFAAYASACIRNRILDAVKRSQGSKSAALNNFLPLAECENLTDGEDVESRVIASERGEEMTQKMRAALSNLEFRAMLLYADGHSLGEISALLGCTYKSIDNAISRAKRKLQRIFG